MRVAVIGNSGSGKSTLARQLANANNAALLDLDTVAWVQGQIAAPQDPTIAAAAVEFFCLTNPSWVVDGCYASLVEVALNHQPHLIFLDPGEEQCVANCRSRPWEPHKYDSMVEQNERLPFLIAWVQNYYVRQGDMSHAEHVSLFESYAGPKQWLRTLPEANFSIQSS